MKIFILLLKTKDKVFQTFLKMFALTLPVLIPEEERKLTQSFIFILLCGASKDFMMALKAFMKPVEASQSVKIKIYINFYFNITLSDAWDGKG